MLGEYAVLAGAPALVLAVDRRCRAEIGRSSGALCHLLSTAGANREVVFAPDALSGVALVDQVLQGLPGAGTGSWRGVLDSSGFFAGGKKLGLGSSAAALTAWSGAWAAWSGQDLAAAKAGALWTLIDLHRAFQGGTGSGLDVAASLHGGVIRFQWNAASGPLVSPAKLPDGMGFAGVFVRSSASTRDHVARYEARTAASPAAAAARMRALARVAEDGIACAAADDADGFLGAIREYAEGLESLGEWIGVDIFSPEHLRVKRLAERFGVAYKVSGAGGGDLGLGFSGDAEALAQFKEVAGRYSDTMELAVEPVGLAVELAGQ